MNAHTHLAISTYHRLRRAERRVDRLTVELMQHVVSIPDDEMDEYVAATGQEDER